MRHVLLTPDTLPGDVPEIIRPSYQKDTGFSRQLLLLGMNAAIGGFLYGYDSSSMGASLLQLKESSDGRNNPCPGLLPGGLDLSQQQMVTSFVVLGGFLGASGAGPSNLYLGRRFSLLSGSCIFMFGAVMMAISNNLTLMLVARLVTGVGVGISSHTVPLYISECAPSQLRGALCTINNFMIVVGQLTAAIVSTLFFYSEVVNGWRWILGLGAVPAVVMFIGFALQPESPRWLLSQGRTEDAREVLALLRGTAVDSPATQHELNDMAETIEVGRLAPSEENFFSMCFRQYVMDSRVRKALILGCGLQILQQWSGINTIMYYGATILQYTSPPSGTKTGTCFTSESKGNVAWTILFASGQLPGIFCAWCMVDKLGRRPLVLTSVIATGTSLILCGGMFTVGDVRQHAVVACVYIYLVSFGFGLSPIPWTINAEIYPLPVRAQCISCSTGAHWLNNYIVSATCLSLAEALSFHPNDPRSHPDGLFWLYALVLMIGFGFLYRNMPETKGMALEQIEALFKDPDDCDEDPLQIVRSTKQA